MAHTNSETSPGVVSVEQGQILLDGPDGVAVAMTPEAAAETGRRLIAAADDAVRDAAIRDAPSDGSST